MVAQTEPALAVVNHLLSTGQTSLEELQARYAVGIDFWSGTLNTDIVLRLANPLIGSIAESRTFYLCYMHNLPAPIPQYPIRDEQGTVLYYVDFAWPELGRVPRVRRQGEVHAASQARRRRRRMPVFREKRREDRIRELTGWRCIRLTWADLERPAHTAARIRRALFPATVISG